MNYSQIVCCQGQKALNICSFEACKSQTGALICGDEQCECNINHKECLMTFSVNQLLRMMEAKGKSYLPMLQRLVEFYDKTIKYFTIQKQQVLKIMGQCSLALNHPPKEIYLKLKQKKIISNKLSIRAISSLMRESKFELAEIESHLNSEIIGIDKSLKAIVDSLKKYQQFHGDSIFQMSHVKVSTVDNKATGIKVTNNRIKCLAEQTIENPNPVPAQPITNAANNLFNPYHQTRPVLPLPSKYFMYFFESNLIQPNCAKYRCFKLKIINIGSKYKQNNQIVFGICLRSSMKSSLDQSAKTVYYDLNSNKGHELCAIGNQLVYSNGTNQSSQFSFASGDIIAVQFYPQIKSIVFVNKNSRCKPVTKYMQYNADSILSLCVGFQREDQEVEYLGEYDQFGRV